MIVSAVRTTSVLTVIFGIVGIPTLSSIVVKVCAYLSTHKLLLPYCTLRIVKIVSAVRTTTSVLTVIFEIVGIPTLSSIVVKVCTYLMYAQTVTAILYIENCQDRHVQLV